MKIVHLITGLSTGGAEMMLYKLLSHMSRERFQPVVVSLIDRGTLGDPIETLGIPVYTIGMKPGLPTPLALWRLIRLLRQLKPDIIQGWMYHGNLAALLAALILKDIPIVWNIRQSLYSLADEKPGTAVVIRLCAWLSKLATKILYNSQASAIQHEKRGFNPDTTLVIPNGFNTELFTPLKNKQISLRSELDVPSQTILIGLIARFHPMKDHKNFLQAAAILHKKYHDVNFVMVGKKVDRNNEALSKLIDELGLTEQVHCLGERQDIPIITASLDIVTSSSSHGEGFPNVVGEALACGVPCVVTDVGDSAWIVGDYGRVVPPRNPEELANAWKELIDMGVDNRQALGKAGRSSIVERFSIDSVVEQYENLYTNILKIRLDNLQVLESTSPFLQGLDESENIQPRV